MNPAWSVIFFTVLAGFGQGLAVTLAFAVLAGAMNVHGAVVERRLGMGRGLRVAQAVVGKRGRVQVEGQARLVGLAFQVFLEAAHRGEIGLAAHDPLAV